MAEDEIVEIIEKIMREHLKSLDMQRSFEHYLVFEEIKLIYKDKIQ